VKKSSKTSSKRKQSPDKELRVTARNWLNQNLKYGGRLAAHQRIYKGVVESFASVKMKHKIICDDGDVEILKLTEKSKLIEEQSMPDQGLRSDGESPDEASKMPKRKKANTSDEPPQMGEAHTQLWKGEFQPANQKQHQSQVTSRRMIEK